MYKTKSKFRPSTSSSLIPHFGNKVLSVSGDSCDEMEKKTTCDDTDGNLSINSTSSSSTIREIAARFEANQHGQTNSGKCQSMLNTDPVRTVKSSSTSTNSIMGRKHSGGTEATTTTCTTTGTANTSHNISTDQPNSGMHELSIPMADYDVSSMRDDDDDWLITESYGGGCTGGYGHGGDVHDIALDRSSRSAPVHHVNSRRRQSTSVLPQRQLFESTRRPNFLPETTNRINNSKIQNRRMSVSNADSDLYQATRIAATAGTTKNNVDIQRTADSTSQQQLRRSWAKGKNGRYIPVERTSSPSNSVSQRRYGSLNDIDEGDMSVGMDTTSSVFTAPCMNVPNIPRNGLKHSQHHESTPAIAEVTNEAEFPLAGRLQRKAKIHVPTKDARRKQSNNTIQHVNNQEKVCVSRPTLYRGFSEEHDEVYWNTTLNRMAMYDSMHNEDGPKLPQRSRGYAKSNDKDSDSSNELNGEESDDSASSDDVHKTQHRRQSHKNKCSLRPGVVRGQSFDRNDELINALQKESLDANQSLHEDYVLPEEEESRSRRRNYNNKQMSLRPGVLRGLSFDHDDTMRESLESISNLNKRSDDDDDDDAVEDDSSSDNKARCQRRLRCSNMSLRPGVTRGLSFDRDETMILALQETNVGNAQSVDDDSVSSDEDNIRRRRSGRRNNSNHMSLRPGVTRGSSFDRIDAMAGVQKKQSPVTSRSVDDDSDSSSDGSRQSRRRQQHRSNNNLSLRPGVTRGQSFDRNDTAVINALQQQCNDGNQSDEKRLSLAVDDQRNKRRSGRRNNNSNSNGNVSMRPGVTRGFSFDRDDTLREQLQDNSRVSRDHGLDNATSRARPSREEASSSSSARDDSERTTITEIIRVDDEDDNHVVVASPVSHSRFRTSRRSYERQDSSSDQ
jgi:hypothetical protein